MIDSKIFIEKRTRLQNYLKRIDDTVKNDINRVKNPDIQDIVVLNLQRSIQNTIDMASYIVLTKRLGIPASLLDIFFILEKNKIITKTIRIKMGQMIDFRNIAVHDYQAIDPAILKSILSLHLKDFEDFYDAIIKKCGS